MKRVWAVILSAALWPSEGFAQAARAAVTKTQAPLGGISLGAVSPSLAPDLSLSPGIAPLDGPALNAVAPLVLEIPHTSEPAAPVEALAASVAEIQSVSRNDSSGLATRAAAEPLFEGRPNATSSLSLGFESEPARLDKSSKRQIQGQPAPPAKPRTSLTRSFQVGFLAAVVPLILAGALYSVAAALGYEFHPSYDLGEQLDEDIEDPGPLGALQTAAILSVFGPIAEEVIFRGGVLGGLLHLARKSASKAAFWLPAALSSLIFVAIHETSDPLLMAGRFLTYMTWSYAFRKEGLLSTMAAHGISNGVMTLPMLAVALLGPALGGAAASLATLALIPAAIVVWRSLKAQQPEIDSGRLVPKPFRARMAAYSAWLLLPGVILLPNTMWIAALLALVYYIQRLKTKKP